MKILITGGAGFLGSHLCKRFLDEGHEVICVDNLLTGSEKNIASVRSNPRFQFINFDVCNPLPDDLSADQVYHMASPASPNHHSLKSYHALAFETMQVNSNGTWHLCEFAIKNKAKFLYASTSESYGDPLEHPQKESYRGNVSTTGPRSVYDEAKRFGETIVAAFVRSKGLNGRIVRIFNTYGPDMAIDDGRVVVEFVKKALRNEPIPIFGEGKQTRSFCYVDDLVEGLTLLMNTTGTKGEVVNVGNPGEFTIIELAELVIKMTNSKSTIQFAEELPKDDPLMRQPDISKAEQLLGFKPKISLEEGLVSLITYVKSELMI
jgi:nucleoside-diphosphate-sugar epimerase